MRILIDTSVFIFAAQEPHRIPKNAFSLLADPENAPEISTVSIAEIALKNATGKLIFSPLDVQHSLRDLAVRVLPFTEDHAFRLFDLPLHHRDPFDRQIIAQALSESVPVLTSDRSFHSYKSLEIVW